RHQTVHEPAEEQDLEEIAPEDSRSALSQKACPANGAHRERQVVHDQRGDQEERVRSAQGGEGWRPVHVPGEVRDEDDRDRRGAMPFRRASRKSPLPAKSGISTNARPISEARCASLPAVPAMLCSLAYRAAARLLRKIASRALKISSASIFVRKRSSEGRRMW